MKRVKLWLVICGTILIISGCGSSNQDDTSSDNALTGTWVLDTTQSTLEETHDFDYIEDGGNILHTLSLYNDGTYVAEFAFTNSGGTYLPNVGHISDGTTKFYIDEDECTGSYAIIHDGNSISLDNTGYFDFELSEDVLVITGQQGGTYLYNRSGTVDKAGRYQLSEARINGMATDQFSGMEYILELREDHLLGATQRTYAQDGSVIDETETLDVDSTWRLEDGNLLITFSNSGTRETMETELNDDGFTLIVESDGIVQEAVFKSVDPDKS